jgi:hypothetical protein
MRYLSASSDNVFMANVVRALMSLGAVVRVKNQLDHPAAISEIDKNDAAMVPSHVHPTDESLFLADLLGPQRAAATIRAPISQISQFDRLCLIQTHQKPLSV